VCRKLGRDDTIANGPMIIPPKSMMDSIAVETPGQRVNVLIKGEARCNGWQQDCWYKADQRYAVSVPPDPRFPDADRFGIELRCPDMNLHYPEGSLLLCVPLDAVEGGIEVDQRYLIECRRRRGRNQETELTVKTLTTESGNRPKFVTESSEPGHQMSVPLFGDGGGRIRPIALVTGFVEPE